MVVSASTKSVGYVALNVCSKGARSDASDYIQSQGVIVLTRCSLTGKFSQVYGHVLNLSIPPAADFDFAIINAIRQRYNSYYVSGVYERNPDRPG
jgi:hypothetical protein